MEVLMTGSLTIKHDRWVMVLYGEYATFNPGKQSADPEKKSQKWISTGLPATTRNRAVANRMMFETIKKYESEEAARKAELADTPAFAASSLLFTDYIADWLRRKQGEIRQITLEGYEVYANRHIIPYFKRLNLTLGEVRPKHIAMYYQYKATGGRLDKKDGGLGNRSLRSHAQLIEAVLNEAVIMEYIPRNPALNVPIPKKPKSNTASKNVFMTAEEANKMLVLLRDEEVYPLVYVAINYALRKSEVLGLKWSAIDFEKDTLEIKSTVVKHRSIVYQDDTKTENSHNTFVLMPDVKELLLRIKEQKEKFREEYGLLYTELDYVFTHDDGRLYRPDCITRSFQRALKRHDLPEMRFHDLRHSTASILFDKGWDIEAIKSWLRHADIETTSNIYMHISKDRKKLLAGDMEGTFVSPFNDDSADSSETISEESNTGELFHTEKEKAAG